MITKYSQKYINLSVWLVLASDVPSIRRRSLPLRQTFLTGYWTAKGFEDNARLVAEEHSKKKKS